MTAHGRYRGILFDLDGTVADTLATIAAALNSGLAALSLPRHELHAVARMVGEGVRVLCERALPAGKGERLDALLLAVRAAYEREPLQHARLYVGMRELLDALRARDARLAILSNKPHDLTVRTVDGLGVGAHFHCVLGHRAEFPHKPDPTSARHVLAQLGLDPSAVLYVGDTCIDRETARAAGMCSVAVTWGFRTRAELLACAPDHVVDHPREVLALYDAAPQRA